MAGPTEVGKIPDGGLLPAGAGRRPTARSILALSLCAALAVLAALALTTLSSRVAPAARRLGALPSRQSPRDRFAAALPANLLSAASVGVGASERSFWPTRDGNSLIASGGGIRSTFTADGATLRVSGGALALSLASVGRARHLAPFAPSAPVSSANEILYSTPAVSESFRNGPYGLEQGFTVRKRPAAGSGPLVLALGVDGSLTARQNGSQVLFQTPAGATALRYGQLSATDAAGRKLPARMQMRGGALQLVIDDAGARYPIHVDPFVQEGAKLTDTEKAEDADFGLHVALSGDGNTALIAGDDAAWVFVREGSAWKQQTKLTGTGGAGFGDSVALSADGDTAIVGAEATSSFVGAAFVFARKASTWELQAKLTGKGEVGEGAFGSGVALSGNGATALVGARNNEHEAGKELGAVWVFARTGSTWEERTEFTDNERLKEANFGSSVALSSEGTTALIGAERYKSSEGAAWVFTGSGASWTQQEKLTGESGAGAFGHSIALSANGDTALVGAYHNGANSPGAAWVFVREGSKWRQPGTKLPSKLENGEDFGDSVALSGEGNTAIVGGEGNGGGQGAVWVFAREGAAWTEQASKLTGKEEKTREAGDAFGAGVALSANGGVALIGGPKDEGEFDSGFGRGAAWVFVTPPEVVTEGSSAISQSAATVTGTVNPNGAEVSGCVVEYGTTEALGSSAPCASSPGSGTEPVPVSAAIVGLAAETTYYYRVAATNLAGTGDGQLQTLKTLPAVVEPPSSVAFTITPDTDPLISLKTYTFAITNPEPGVTYQWDFGDKDSPLDSAGAPFVVEATGDTVTYAYPSPPVLDNSADGSLCLGGECTDGSPFAVYLVRAQATVPQGGTPVQAPPQRVVVIPVQRPTASFLLLRSQKNNEGTGVTTAVTKPVTIVPQAGITEPDVNAGDKVVREDFWLNNQGASGTPDLTCLSDGVCGHYIGSAPLTPSTVPSPSELEPIAGQGDDGTGALTQFGTPAPTGLAAHLCALNPKKCFTPQYSSPIGGFESFSMNFWNAALAAIGSPGNPIATLAPEASVQRGGGFYERLPVTVGYPPLTSVNLREANGFDGEQGTGDAFLCELNGSLGPAAYGGAEIGGPDTCVGGCFLGYPLGGGQGTPVAPSCYSGIEPNKEHCGDDIICLGGQGTGFFPIDLAKFGPYSVQHYEDEANFLYNYATVVGVDTPLDDQIGPATGARKRLSGAIVPRTVTMVAYDAEGVASEPSTQSVPLTPASNPTLRVCVEDVTAGSPCVETGTKKPLPVPITEGDTLRFKTTGSNGGDDPIAYYSTTVGQPNTVQDCEDGGVPYYEIETLRPGDLGETHDGTGTNPTEVPRGPVAKGASAHRAHASTRHAHAAVSISKGNGTGVKIEANPIVEYINGAKQTPFPIPDFSDLLSGAFPYHDCPAYAIRTVDPNLAVAPLPKGGPNEIAHIASVRRSGHGARARKAGSSSLPSVKVTPSATAEASGLEFEFPHEGKYSVSVAAYNTSGLGAITRIDGFEATKAVQDGPCEAVNSIPLNIHDPHTHREAELGFSGECVSVVTAENSSHDGKGHPLLYASTTSIDIDGVPLVPQSGDAIVIRPVSQESNSETHKSGREVEIFVAACKISAFETSSHTADGYCHQSHVGTLYLSLGGGKNQSPPGIAAWETSFTGAAARAAFGPRAGGSKPVSGCGELPGAQAWKAVKESGGEHLYAAFEGFEVVHSACVEFTEGQGSKIEFHDQLPTAFQRKGTRASSTVRLEGRDVPTVSLLETNNYASVARHRGARRAIDGSPSKVRAHKAEIGFPSVPNCIPQKHNPNELEIPEGDELGPIEMPVGAHFCYDKATGDFTGNVKVNIPGPAVFPLNGVEVGFEIGHGRLIDAGGEISGNLPVGPGVLINELKFDIQTDPTVVAGAIEASIADFLAVEAATVVSPSIPEVAIEGTVTLPIGGFKLGEFELVFHKSTVKMRVAVHEQFGPAELELAVQGAMQFDPEFAFFVEGSGKACLWICLSAKGIVSNIGLAACGEINLLFFTVSAGVGVLWSGPNSGVHVFTGCDLNGYRPPSLRNITFGRVAYPAHTSRAGPGGQPTAIQKLKTGGPPAPPPKQSEIPAGGHETLTLNPGGLCTPTDENGCEKGVVAVQVHSLASSAGVGVTPQVTLTGPAPEDTRAITTPSTPDQFSFTPQMSAGDTGMSTPGPTDEGTAIVDQDPVPLYDLVENSSAFCAQPSSANAAMLSASCPRVVTTTILVADPGKGEWTLGVDPESPPVVDVAVAQPEPQVAPIEFNPSVHPVKLSPIFHGKLARVSAVSHALVIPSKTRNLDSLIAHHDLVLSPSVEMPATTPKIQSELAHPSAADLDVPAIDAGLLRSVQLKVPPKWKGTVAVIDEGAAGEEDVIASHISTSMIPRGGLPILFKPVADFGATHEIKAFLSNEEGIPSRTIVLSTYKAPALPTPSAPSIVKIVRLGSTVDVYFKPGDAPITEGIGLALSAGNGLTIEGRTPFSRLHAIGGRHGLGAAAQAGEYMLSIHHVDPTVSVDIALDDSSGGKLSATTRRYLRPSMSSIGESALIRSAHIFR